MVVEFSYGVYTTSASLYNWKDSQRLSFVASSGFSLAVKSIADAEGFHSYTYPGTVEMPVLSILEGFEGSVLIKVEDENAKFNINAVLKEHLAGKKALDSLKRLLGLLNINEDIAEYIADWIDKDGDPRFSDSEDDAKNAYLDSIDELRMIKSIDADIYEKLLPYVTVYGYEDRIDSDLININTASIPVIMSLNEGITEGLAERVVAYRDLTPFENASDIVKVAGFEETLGSAIQGSIMVKATNFRISSTTDENRITRIIETVVFIKQGNHTVKYWREM
jgi:general secretion pathway protein K